MSAIPSLSAVHKMVPSDLPALAKAHGREVTERGGETFIRHGEHEIKLRRDGTLVGTSSRLLGRPLGVTDGVRILGIAPESYAEWKRIAP